MRAAAPVAEREPLKSWRDYWLPAMASGLIALIIAITVSFSGRVIQGGETNAVLTSQIGSVSEDIREQKRLTQELLLRISGLYTREEARQDREAAERRFQGFDNRISDLTRRIETLETSNRFLQQSLMERGGKPR